MAVVYFTLLFDSKRDQEIVLFTQASSPVLSPPILYITGARGSVPRDKVGAAPSLELIYV
jgi:hypothetical protein